MVPMPMSIFISILSSTPGTAPLAPEGAAETDAAHYFKLGEKLYLLIWREKLLPAVGVIVVDLDSMRSTGKLYYEKLTALGAPLNVQVGARLTLLNETRY